MPCRKHWFDDGANVVVDGGAVEGGAVAGGVGLLAGVVGDGIPGIVGELGGWVLGLLGLGTEGVRRYNIRLKLLERGYDCCWKENWGTSCGFVAAVGGGDGVSPCGTLLPTCTSSVGPPLGARTGSGTCASLALGGSNSNFLEIKKFCRASSIPRVSPSECCASNNEDLDWIGTHV